MIQRSKKLLSLLLVFVLVLGLMPAGAVAAPGQGVGITPLGGTVVTNEADLRTQIDLGNDVIVNNVINLTNVVTINNTVTLSGTGVLTVSANHRHFDIRANGNLTLAGNVTLTRALGYEEAGGGVVTNSPTAVFNMTGGVIRDNHNTTLGGGGVQVSGNPGATFNMHGGTIRGNTSSANGGGVIIGAGANFNMHGGTISGNRSYAGGGGGGVMVNAQSSTFIMHDGYIINNSARHGGGVLFNGPAIVHGGTIRGNGGNSSWTGAEDVPEYNYPWPTLNLNTRPHGQQMISGRFGPDFDIGSAAIVEGWVTYRHSYVDGEPIIDTHTFLPSGTQVTVRLGGEASFPRITYSYCGIVMIAYPSTGQGSELVTLPDGIEIHIPSGGRAVWDPNGAGVTVTPGNVVTVEANATQQFTAEVVPSVTVTDSANNVIPLPFPYTLTWSVAGHTNASINPVTGLLTIGDIPNGTMLTVTASVEGMGMTNMSGSTRVVVLGATGNFTVTFHANGGTGAVPVDPETYDRGDSVQALPSNLTRVGYAQVGWRLDCPTSGAMILPGGTFTIQYDATLYAWWMYVGS